MRKLHNLLLAMIFIPFFSIPMLTHADEIKPAKEPKRPSFIYRPDSRQQFRKYTQALGILPVIDTRLSKFYGDNDSFYKDPIPKGLNRLFNLELRSSGLFDEVTSIAELSSINPNISEIQAIGSAIDRNLIMLVHLTKFNLTRLPINYYSKGINPDADFANSVSIAFICQIIDVKTGLILFAEEISRESFDYAEAGSFNMKSLEMITKDALAKSFQDLKLLIQETGIRLNS